MRKEELIQRLRELPDDRYALIAPYIEADLEFANDLDSMHNEIEAGRKSAASEPVFQAKDVYTRARQAAACRS